MTTTRPARHRRGPLTEQQAEMHAAVYALTFAGHVAHGSDFGEAHAIAEDAADYAVRHYKLMTGGAK